jgi:oligopeptide transport system substrate-binding protein
MASFPGSRAGRAAAAVALLGALGLGVLALGGRTRIDRADFAFTCGGEVRSLDPHSATGVPEGRIIRALYEGLLGRDPASMAPTPGVAAAWEVSPDALTYTFHLRADARWSNGDPLTAEDFEWSFRRLLAPETAAEYAYLLWPVEGAREFTTGVDESGAPVERDWSRVGIRASDERTLEIRLAKPLPYFLQVLAYHALAPVHRQSLEAAAREFPDSWQVEWTRPERLVTNGPFRLVERRVNDRIRMARNEEYWDASRVAMRTVDALAIENWTSALNLYLTGGLDWVDGSIPLGAVPDLMGREDYCVAPYLGAYFLRVNCTKPPLDDGDVRRALALAVPKLRICQRLLRAGQRPLLTWVPYGAIGSYESTRKLDESVELARMFLEKAGYWSEEEGCTLPPLEIHFNSSEVHRDIAEVIAEAWRDALGLEVRLRNQEWKTFLDAQASLEYDLSRSSWIADFPDPASFFDVWLSGGENNRTGWSSPAYDALVERARHELDPAARNRLYRQAEDILLHELPLIPIYSYVSQNLVDPRLGGMPPSWLNEVSPKHWYWMDDQELQKTRERRGGKRVESHGPRAGLRAPASAGGAGSR